MTGTRFNFPFITFTVTTEKGTFKPFQRDLLFLPGKYRTSPPRLPRNCFREDGFRDATCSQHCASGSGQMWASRFSPQHFVRMEELKPEMMNDAFQWFSVHPDASSVHPNTLGASPSIWNLHAAEQASIGSPPTFRSSVDR